MTPREGVELSITTGSGRGGCTVWVPGKRGGISNEIDLSERQMRLLAYALLSRIPAAERRDYFDRLSAAVGPATLFAPLREVEIDDGHNLLAGKGAVGQDNESHAGVLHRDLVPDIRKRRGHGVALFLKKVISVATAAKLRTRLRNAQQRPALEDRMARWAPPRNGNHQLSPLPEGLVEAISSERALGNLNAAWAELHRAMHRSVPADQLRAIQQAHRQAVRAYVNAACREFGQ